MIKRKAIGFIVGIVVMVVAFVATFLVVSKGLDKKQSTKTQLATVENLKYDQQNNLLSWDDVTNADLYNVSVNGKETSVEDNFYTVALTEQRTEFKVQAKDTTNTYATSKWSKSLIITLEQEESLVAQVNAFASKIAREDYALQKVLSLRARNYDGNNPSEEYKGYLVTTAVYTVAGDNYLCEFETRYTDKITSLEEALKREDARANTLSIEFDLAKNYDTASSFLSRSEYSEQIQNLVNEGYTLSFVTSQAYEAGSDTVGIKGILKAEKSSNTRYFSVDIEIYVGNIGIETAKYTVAVEQAEWKALYEGLFLELTGDFAEYAKELESIQNANK